MVTRQLGTHFWRRAGLTLRTGGTGDSKWEAAVTGNASAPCTGPSACDAPASPKGIRCPWVPAGPLATRTASGSRLVAAVARGSGGGSSLLTARDRPISAGGQKSGSRRFASHSISPSRELVLRHGTARTDGSDTRVLRAPGHASSTAEPSQHLPNAFPTPSQCLPNAFPTPSQLLPNTFPTPSQCLPNTFPMPSQHLPNAFPTPSQLLPNAFPTPSQHLSNAFPMPSQLLPNIFPAASQHLPNAFPTPSQHLLNCFPTPSQHFPNSFPTPSQLLPNSFPTPSQLLPNAFPPSPTPPQCLPNAFPTLF